MAFKLEKTYILWEFATGFSEAGILPCKIYTELSGHDRFIQYSKLQVYKGFTGHNMSIKVKYAITMMFIWLTHLSISSVKILKKV